MTGCRRDFRPGRTVAEESWIEELIQLPGVRAAVGMAGRWGEEGEHQTQHVGMEKFTTVAVDRFVGDRIPESREGEIADAAVPDRRGCGPKLGAARFVDREFTGDVKGLERREQKVGPAFRFSTELIEAKGCSQRQRVVDEH